VSGSGQSEHRSCRDGCEESSLQESHLVCSPLLSILGWQQFGFDFYDACMPCSIFREPPPSFREGLSKRDNIGMKRRRALILFRQSTAVSGNRCGPSGSSLKLRATDC
jgi:hypothetical protein